MKFIAIKFLLFTICFLLSPCTTEQRLEYHGRMLTTVRETLV
jgi:hypothetical protein